MDTQIPFESVTKKIPEFYFDVISRFPPGIVIVLSCVIEFTPEGFISKQDVLKISASLALLILLFLFVFAYVFGLITASTSKEFFKKASGSIFKNYISKKEIEINWCVRYLNILELQNKNDQGKRYPKPVEQYEAGDFWLIHRRLHDYLKSKDEQARLILPKLSAEHSLILNLFGSLIIIFFIHLLHILDMYLRFNAIYFVPSLIFYIVWIGVTIWLWFGSIFRFQRLLDSEFSYLEIVTKKNTKVN